MMSQSIYLQAPSPAVGHGRRLMLPSDDPELAALEDKNTALQNLRHRADHICNSVWPQHPPDCIYYNKCMADECGALKPELDDLIGDLNSFIHARNAVRDRDHNFGLGVLAAGGIAVLAVSITVGTGGTALGFGAAALAACGGVGVLSGGGLYLLGDEEVPLTSKAEKIMLKLNCLRTGPCDELIPKDRWDLHAQPS